MVGVFLILPYEYSGRFNAVPLISICKISFQAKPFFKSHTHYVSGVVSKIQVHF